MSDLKDRFAMAAMVAILRRENKPSNYLDVAQDAYMCADFMVSERQKQIDFIAFKEKQNK